MPVCRAIISSSLVGITQAETLLSGVEIRGPLPCIRRFVEFDAEPGRTSADSLADLRRVLSDAGGEHQAVDAAEDGRERADLLARPDRRSSPLPGAPPARCSSADRACRC